MLSSHHNISGMEGPRDKDGIDYLLDLNGWVSEVGGCLWIKACVHRTEPCDSVPHGISYSLTLHKPNGERVVGYDNAHPFSEKQGMRRMKVPTADHRHYRDRILAYTFVSPVKLLEDFWADVARFLREEGVAP